MEGTLRVKLSPQERRARILQFLSEGLALSVSDLAERLGASQATIRRDLVVLEQESPSVRRGWGSVASATSIVERVFASKLNMNRPAKEWVAQAVAQRVDDGWVLFMNGGTTTTLAARAIAHASKHVTIVTNAVNIAYELASYRTINVVVVGGSIRPMNYEVTGATALSVIRQFHANVAILGCNGLTADLGASTVAEIEAEVGRAMASRADEVWIVADRTKVGRSSLIAFVEAQRIRRLFSEDVEPALLGELSKSTEVIMRTTGDQDDGTLSG